MDALTNETEKERKKELFEKYKSPNVLDQFNPQFTFFSFPSRADSIFYMLASLWHAIQTPARLLPHLNQSLLSLQSALDLQLLLAPRVSVAQLYVVVTWHISF